MNQESLIRKNAYFWLAVTSLLLIYLLDYWGPSGVAFSVFYVAAIAFASLSRLRFLVVVIAALSGLLVLISACSSNAPEAIHHSMAVIPIGITTWLCASRRESLPDEARQQAFVPSIETAIGSEALRLKLLNSTAEGICGIDLSGRCTFANTTCLRMLGYDSPSDLLGQNMHELIHHSYPDGRAYPKEACTIYQAFRQGKGTHSDREVLWRKDRSSFVCEFWSHPLFQEGEPIGSVVTFLDITQRRKEEDGQRQVHEKLVHLVAQGNTELIQTRDRLELALNGANIGLWDWNAKTNEVYYSPTFKTQLGYPPDAEFRNFSDWESRLHPDDHDSAVQCVQDYFDHLRDDYKSTFRMRCLDGSYRWMLSLGRAEFDEEDKPLRVIGVHVDITERIENEQELERLNTALAQSNEALKQSNIDLQQFAYVASHDLQTPLRGIANFAQLLQDDYHGKLDATADDYIDRIVAGAKRMQQLIQDLLMFSRVESRGTSFAATNLNEVFDDAVVMMQVAIEESGAVVTRDDLPFVFCDRSQLSQLLQNLIGNGIKYHGDDPPKIHLSSEQINEHWRITVRDNGIGIASQHQDRIFEVFRRLHTNQEYPGTGIGLAVCRRIVNRHGGEIWVESEPGHGSTFFFTMPHKEL